jgi:anthranilate synthase/aminodeoxychorismate synthase-like glutamine amidotransferase
MNALFIDNFDSFTFNLVDELRRRGVTVQVWRNDLAPEEALARALALPAPRLVLLSPGPSSPAEAGCCVPLLRLAAGQVPVFGVCLGLQCMVEAFGGVVSFAGEVVHGKASPVTHDGSGLFAGLPSPLTVGRYHSLVGRTIPPELRVTARCGELVMAAEHRVHRIAGVQFHPESILTPLGGALIDNVLRWAAAPAGSGDHVG